MKKMVIKEFTNIYDKKENGTLHGYDYFEKDGKYVYNFSFHNEYGFSHIQLIEKTKNITYMKKKAYKKFINTLYTNKQKKYLQD